ncbi:hypothetical protein B0F90DRAFT_1817176 [Multifurca ochricompacta]|uniref:Uncharacterized protein n=1 Tax=Multifurca ochricompacta TaxID=376703 RepID=A0AAD4QMD3_9AGAM|nr:hypothetical protein B0F90DRAFT_1817176 [Multifurca ochricompacta]
MSLPPATNGRTPSRYTTHPRPSLLPQQLGPYNRGASQPTLSDNLRRFELSNRVDYYRVPTPWTSREAARNMNPSSHTFPNVQSPDFGWPGAAPPPQENPFLQVPADANLTPRATCSCCPTQPVVSSIAPVPVPVYAPAPAHPGAGQLALPNQDGSVRLGPTLPSMLPLSQVDPGPLLFRSPVPDAPVRGEDISDMNGMGWPPTVDSGNAYTSRRVPSIRVPPRRLVPLVRIEDQIEWVRPGVLKMTLWFNWSPDAGAERNESWE